MAIYRKPTCGGPNQWRGVCYNPDKWYERRKKKKEDEAEYQLRASVFYRSPEWRELREEIIEEQGCVCQNCSLDMSENRERINVDHIKPLKRFWGLRLEKANLQILCADCNKEKGNKYTRPRPEPDQSREKKPPRDQFAAAAQKRALFRKANKKLRDQAFADGARDRLRVWRRESLKKTIKQRFKGEWQAQWSQNAPHMEFERYCEKRAGKIIDLLGVDLADLTKEEFFEIIRGI